MHATAACDHSGVVLLGRCCTSLDCCLLTLHGLVVMEAVSLVCQLFGALVLAVYAAPYFRWGDTRQNVEVPSSSWADASCHETACLIQSSVNELAMCGTGPDRTAILGHGET